MKNRFLKNRKAKYGGIALLLTVLIVTVTVLLNAVFSTLAKRYAWYGNMNAVSDYRVSDNCYALLEAVLGNSTDRVQIIFCDTAENWQSETTQKYVYDSAKQLEERFPNRIEVVNHNIWLNPDSVKKYREIQNVSTGEIYTSNLKSTNVIMVSTEHPENYRVYALTEFFVFKDGDSSNVWAYSGEKKLAAGILHAVSNEEKLVCLTNNHGEAYYDYELLYLLDDAGYNLAYLDLYREEIPAGCSLILTFNPNSDFTEKEAGISDYSESEKLEAFLSASGNAYTVFLENGTPSLPNLEKFLGTWGVSTRSYTDGESGFSYRYMMQDNGQSLTSDGYTIYGDVCNNAYASEIIGTNNRTVFKNATALTYSAEDGFAANGFGGYANVDGSRVLYGLFQSSSSSSAWANGKTRDGGNQLLMTMTLQTNADGGTSYVTVSGSVKVAVEDQLQSAVYGNTDALLHVLRYCGMNYSPIGLSFKPFQSTDISIITTAQMWRWTLILALLPAVTFTAAGVTVLVKRRNA